MDETRQLYIISGCNGAGKTTASYTVLPEILLCKEFVNADEIAKGLSPFNPESMAIEAGRLMLKRINELLAAKVSFSIETTLATRSYTRLIQRAQNAGYKVSLIYFWLNSPELAVNRVLQRVNEGGHNVPIDVIYRRYQAGINNLFQIYMPRVDYWLLADNSISPRVIVAEGYQHGEDSSGSSCELSRRRMFHSFLGYYSILHSNWQDFFIISAVKAAIKPPRARPAQPPQRPYSGSAAAQCR